MFSSSAAALCSSGLPGSTKTERTSIRSSPITDTRAIAAPAIRIGTRWRTSKAARRSTARSKRPPSTRSRTRFGTGSNASMAGVKLSETTHVITIAEGAEHAELPDRLDRAGCEREEARCGGDAREHDGLCDPSHRFANHDATVAFVRRRSRPPRRSTR